MDDKPTWAERVRGLTSRAVDRAASAAGTVASAAAIGLGAAAATDGTKDLVNQNRAPQTVTTPDSEGVDPKTIAALEVAGGGMLLVAGGAGIGVSARRKRQEKSTREQFDEMDARLRQQIEKQFSDAESAEWKPEPLPPGAVTKTIVHQPFAQQFITPSSTYSEEEVHKALLQQGQQQQ